MQSLKKTITLLLTLFVIFPYISNGQDHNVNCNSLKNGLFYSYPKNSSDRFISKRDGNMQLETNMITGDTTLWKVDWTSDCSYTLKYISGSAKLTTDTKTLFREHKLAYEIIASNSNYYIFNGYIDKTSTLPIQSDTMWLTAKTNVTNQELYKPIANQALIRRAHFSDTSKYAVLYIYRPGKITNSLADYLVYFDDNVICVAKNNSGYIFKILKEGQHILKSRLLKDESTIPVDIKFGNTYYIKSMIHWGIHKRLYNFKLEMAAIEKDKALEEIAEVEINK